MVTSLVVASVAVTGCGGTADNSSVRATAVKQASTSAVKHATRAPKSPPNRTTQRAVRKRHAIEPPRTAKRVWTPPPANSSVATVAGRAVQFSAIQEVLAASKKITGVPLDPPAFNRCARATAKQWLAYKRLAPSHSKLVADCRRDYRSVLPIMAGMVIRRTWLDTAAVELGITLGRVTNKPAVTADALSGAQQTDPQLLQKLADTVANRAASPSASEIAHYYARNRDSFALPERRSVEVVMTTTRAAAVEAAAALGRGQSAAAVRHAFAGDAALVRAAASISQVSRALGDPTVVRSALLTRIGTPGRPVVSRPRRTTGTPWSRSIDGGYSTQYERAWFVLRVVRSLPPRLQSLTEVRAQISRTLKEQRGSKVRQDFTTHFDDRWRARTQCQRAFLNPTVCGNAKALLSTGAGS